MLVGLCGGLCAGKEVTAQCLVEKYGFQEIIMRSSSERERPNALYFGRVSELVDYVTKRWREHFVLTKVTNETILDELAGRPFFILISVDAPVQVRWRRWKARLEAANKPVPSLEQFVHQSDHEMYDPDTGINGVCDRATIKILNSDGSIDSLRRTIESLNITDPERLRPGWDSYFMQLSSLAARRSNCMKRRVGCVLVRERRVIATGYNGAPRGLKNCNEGGCGRCNSGASGGTGLDTCLCIHAEENALLEAGRERVGEGAVLYCDTCPCLTCSIKLVQVGISEVVYSQGYSMDDRTAAVLKEGGVKLRKYSPPRDGLVKLQQ